MILQKEKACIRDVNLISETGPSMAPESAPLFHTHYHQLQKHSEWKMKLQTESVRNNQFHSPCVYVLLIVILATKGSITRCVFLVCAHGRQWMLITHVRPPSATDTCQKAPVRDDEGRCRGAGGYIFNIKCAVVWVHNFDCLFSFASPFSQE